MSTTTDNEINASRCVDIGINLTNAAFKKNWRDVVRRALAANVDTMLLTGTSLPKSKQSLALAETWRKETSQPNLYCTVGVHPHDAKNFDRTKTIHEMRRLLKANPLAVAVGECGLDYNRNFSTRQEQLRAFRAQVQLACELRLPLFVHEREAHEDLLRVLAEFGDDGRLPPVVVHCFTGSREEAMVYIERGFFLGFTGFICKHERGRDVRAFLSEIPLERILIETDAPFMGFQRGKQRNSEPAHVVGVAQKIAEVHDVPLEEVCTATTRNAVNLFGLQNPEIPIES